MQVVQAPLTEKGINCAEEITVNTPCAQRTAQILLQKEKSHEAVEAKQNNQKLLACHKWEVKEVQQG